MLYKSSRSTLLNAVMKYLNFRSSGSKLETITNKFTKSRTPSEVFFEEFHYKCGAAILKMHEDGCFWEQLYFRKQLHIFYISYSDVMLKRNEFLWIFF